jgi:hypothetical protein
VSQENVDVPGQPDPGRAVDAFQGFWGSGDLATWIDALSEDVVLLSPLFRSTFHGRAAAAELYEVLLGTLGDFSVVERFVSASGSAVVFWRATAGSRRIEGIDVLQLDADGRIREIRVMVRPLVGLAAFSAAVGPELARRRGPVRHVVTRILVAPLLGLFLAIDVIASRLVKDSEE